MKFPSRRRFSQNISSAGVAAITVIFITALAATSPARAQTETVLYSFCSLANCADGDTPVSGLIVDAAGNLYGSTSIGGAASGGVVFKLSPSGDESVLYSFHHGFPKDGYEERSLLAMDAQGNLYGTSSMGGANSLHVPRGDGTAFKVSPDGTETILHNFGAFNTDGVEPLSGMVLDASGNLYGTTNIGGVYTAGTLFRLSPEGVETVLHNFADSGTDGGYPRASLIMDKSGNLYGTTVGSRNPGTVFELTAAGRYQILHRFTGQGDGGEPLASLTLDSQGNLYGTTYGGGSGGVVGTGTVFELTPGSNGSWQETILSNFDQQKTTCQNPYSNVLFDSKGNLYGTTANGGAWGLGCAYKLSPAGKLTVLHSFGEGADGASPLGSIVFSQGNLYGTTAAGGENSEGTVFEITP